MSTLAEIEQAAAKLSPEDKQELLLFLATRLRDDGATLPAPRQFAPAQVAAWIAEDDTDMAKFRGAK